LFALIGWTWFTRGGTPAYSLWSDRERTCEVPVTGYTSQPITVNVALFYLTSLGKKISCSDPDGSNI